MGYVIGFFNQKGGCGKSTTSVHFARWLVNEKNESVCLVDADGQGSSSQWMQRLKAPNIYQVLQTADELLEQIPSLAEDYAYVVVDGPANLADATRAILLSVDLAVMPCQPSGLDLQAVFESTRLVKQAQMVRRGPPQAAAFLSRAIKGTRLKTETLAALKQIDGIKPLKSIVHQRQTNADAFGQGVTVWEMGGTSAGVAAREYDKLFREVLELLP